jgi:exopolyphosphatase/guanosine-5'-triphosphate,3'-diphosphate pyrophosphatase
LFAKHLKSIPKSNIIIVATAALRIARNNKDFINQANTILPKNIQLLSGEQEASTIYSGVAFTESVLLQNIEKQDKRIVIDIGGASTEIIVGEGILTKKLVSLNIGCVSFINKHFDDSLLNNSNFDQCIDDASKEIKMISEAFINIGWQSALGSSGTMQALAEILAFRHEEAIITLPFLHEIKQVLIDCSAIEHINIDGLRADRAAILASGLSILIALFNELSIESMQLSTGALREGLLSQLLPNALLVK